MGIEGLAAKKNNFTFMSKVRRREQGYAGLLDNVRSDGRVPDNAALWRYFSGVLEISSDLRHLLNGLFDQKPAKRFKIAEILSHPWLQGEHI